METCGSLWVTMVQGMLRLKYEMSSQAHVFESLVPRGWHCSWRKRSFERCGLSRGSGSLEAGPGYGSLVLLSVSSFSKIWAVSALYSHRQVATCSVVLLPGWTVSSQTKSQNKCSLLKVFLLGDFATETCTKMYNALCLVRVRGEEWGGQGQKCREEQLKGRN